MRGLPYRCRLASNDARTSTVNRRSSARSLRFGAPSPGVEAARRHLQTPAQDGDRMRGLLRRDERESHRLCFAKKAAAFFRMSRSSWRIAILFAQAGQLLALRGRQARLALGPIRPRLLDPVAQRRTPSGPGRARAAADGLALVEHQPDGAGLELVSETAPSPSRLRVRPWLDIVSASRKMSTKSDQAQTAPARR